MLSIMRIALLFSQHVCFNNIVRSPTEGSEGISIAPKIFEHP